MKRLKTRIENHGCEWSLILPDLKYDEVMGLPCKNSARAIARLAQACFKEGKLQEFKENTKNAQRLMRKFGL